MEVFAPMNMFEGPLVVCISRGIRTDCATLSGLGIEPSAGGVEQTSV